MRFGSNLVKVAAVTFLAFTAQYSAQAITITQTGLFTADNQVFEQTLVIPAAQSVSFYTTSYGGGRNADGSITSAGGFVPILTLFSSLNGKVIGTDGASGMCAGSARMDPATKLCDDAFFTVSLTPGSYVLDLTEFPNGAVDTLSTTPRFLFSSDPNATGSVCGSSTGNFLQADTAPCAQRTGSYAVNASTVPEPGTLLLLVPATGAWAFVHFRRRRQTTR